MTAIISPCGTYRYRLERDASPAFLHGGRQRSTAVIMVNPSTADAEKDDATIRKLRGFGERLGWGRIIVGNLFAYRATNVRELERVADPIGPENNRHLAMILRDADEVIVAWGPMSKLPKRLRTRFRHIVAECDGMGRPMKALATARDGHPCHPLMLAYSSELQPWRPAL